MKRETGRAAAFDMPPTNPAFPAGPYRFVNREYFIIQYRTDPEALRRIVPEPLELTEPVVNYEFHPHARLDGLLATTPKAARSSRCASKPQPFIESSGVVKRQQLQVFDGINGFKRRRTPAKS